MKHARSAAMMRMALGLALVSGVMASCRGEAPPAEHVGEAQAAAFTNGGFETGTAGQAPPAPWTLTDFVNVNGVTIQNPQTYAGLDLTAHGAACTGTNQCTGVTPQQGTTCTGGLCEPASKTIILNSPTGPGTQPDPTLGATASFRWPRYGNQCALVNQLGNHVNVNQLTQTMTVGAADVDPSDGKIHVRLVVAPVLEDPGHPANEQPYFFVQISNVTQNTILYSNYNFSNQAGVPWQTVVNTSTYRYTDWQLIDLAPGSPAINMGDQVELFLVAAGCSLGAHMGELYVDGVGANIPGLYVSGTGPAQVNYGSSITYDLTYKNGSPSTACATSANCPNVTDACVGGVCAETGVVIDFTAPPNTTISSFTSPPGAMCVQAAQTITCTFTGPVTPGQTGNFSVTVQVGAATACTTSANCPTGINCVNGVCDIGQINCGNYGIASTQESHLLGNKITTELGCTLDSQCTAGNWCDESKAACTPTLANGQPIPSDPPHTNPTLNSTCTSTAGALVCTSKVCDTSDNDCGYKNGDGPCTPGATGNGPVVCRSGVCDPDGKCGYANGDGPCTIATGPTVCRSGVCSNAGLCIAAGSCDVDSDCPSADWCDETTHACTPKETNGTQVPTDPPHTNPTLNGTCTAADGPVGPTVCVSGVCDANDGKCGYAIGDGPCTPGPTGNGPTVCRSGVCSTNGTCEPAGGCNVDADCTGGKWCMESTHTCTAKLANGTSLPNDPPHTGPTLNGTCTAAAATLVCASGVCDSDNKCGYLNNDGPCTSGPTGNGPVVCRSGVCDPDMKCGYAVGDGPCTGATGPVVCRSMLCSVSGVCEPSGGCDVDADCTGGNWCDEAMHMCTPKLPNGQHVPTDAPHTNPTLDGTCNAPAGLLTCASGVCDTSDNLCGYANGDGPCTIANGPTVCRSGACSTNGVCEPVGGCNVDADCTGGKWCDESVHMCTPQLANGQQVPNDPPHTSPTLNGTCTAAAGTLTCVSGVCDTNDNECGYANGDGPCTAANAGTVCRSGACSTNGTCEPMGGCNVDADCAAGNWCNETAHMCTPQLANGTSMPTDGAHMGPTLDGTCTAAAGALVCQSGVCDTKDNKCGYANGDGPCTMANGGTVCRSATCSNNGTCEPSGGCNVDADCTSGNWCNESMNACVPTLPNGTVVPTDPPHTNPTLNGTCTMGAGALTCSSGVCDTKDNECGYANGDGPCTSMNGGTVCRSGKCGSNGVCAGCTTNADCKDPTPICNTSSGTCVQCTDSSQCSGTTPLCNTSSSTCVSCNGDNGSGSSEACPSGQPFCFLGGSNAGACGKCMTNADCTGHTGNICDTGTGLCVSGCLVDGDCSSSDWCNANGSTPGMCVAKLTNGTPLPAMPSSVSMCTAAVGMRVCVSGVCDMKDNTCGYAPGDGPCASDEQCRNESCDSSSMTCKAPCTSDEACPSTDYCATSSGACEPKQPDGSTCSANDQCTSGACTEGVCGGPAIASGNGLLCAAQPGRDAGDAGGLAVFGLALAAAGLARRRRR